MLAAIFVVIGLFALTVSRVLRGASQVAAMRFGPEYGAEWRAKGGFWAVTACAAFVVGLGSLSFDAVAQAAH